LGGTGGAQLLVHRIPESCSEQHIYQMILNYTSIVPLQVDRILRVTDSSDGDAWGRANVVFSSTQHADLAFDNIVGPNRPDKQGRSQKRIYLKAQGKGNKPGAAVPYVCIRKY
jgi:hypothetical protein